MRKCLKCNEEFSSIIWINGTKKKLGNRYHCTKCLPLGSNICPYCNITQKSISAHIITCTLNPRHEQNKLNLSIANAKTWQGRNHTDESKKKISEGRKKFLSENPDAHSWSKNKRSKSKPEENFAEFLLRQGISATRFYHPPESDRFFEIDFAFLDSRIAIEINGNQHYNQDGTLKDYYQVRHDYLESLGWALNEIHYSEFFQEENMKKIIDNCLKSKVYYSSDPKIINDRISRSKQPKKPPNKPKNKICPECLGAMSNAAKKCINCSRFEYPPGEEVLSSCIAIGIKPTANKIGCSDTALRKYLIKCKLPVPTGHPFQRNKKS